MVGRGNHRGDAGLLLHVVKIEEMLAVLEGVQTDEVRKLLQDQDHADSGQQTTNDAHRKIDSDHAGSREPERELDNAGDCDSQEERFVRAEHFDLRRYNSSESRGGTAHANVRTAQKTDEDPANRAGDQARDRSGARCNARRRCMRSRSCSGSSWA